MCFMDDLEPRVWASFLVRHVHGVQVWAVTGTGERWWGDILIGADGIWSKVRTQLVGPSKAFYSGYTCYTGISDFVCPDIDTVAYRVFLGSGQYFVSSDVGGGKMQWYAFNEEPAGGKDEVNGQKSRLMKLFGRWCVPRVCPDSYRCNKSHNVVVSVGKWWSAMFM
jgi:2-polyprenyl-6-methoxyphenol hydroxylase-like FAD-dependent oxidoreductase